MDGSVRNLRIGDRRIRLASVRRAVDEFPKYAFFIATGELRVDAPIDSRGSWLVRMTIPGGESSVVLSTDFDRIRAAGLRFAPQPRIFRGKAPSDVLARIGAYLEVLFSDRPAA